IEGRTTHVVGVESRELQVSAALPAHEAVWPQPDELGGEPRALREGVLVLRVQLVQDMLRPNGTDVPLVGVDVRARPADDEGLRIGRRGGLRERARWPADGEAGVHEDLEAEKEVVGGKRRAVV